MSRLITFISALVLTLASGLASATVVKIETSMGDVEVNLFDDKTPQTVANFLSYVNAGSYENTVIHRMVPGFVVQGGGYELGGTALIQPIETADPVINEPVLSNVRGTLAMAKRGSSVNSATSQWFFNLANNSSNLDAQNGGFTVFGQVIGDGMEIIDAIAQLNRFNFNGLQDFPLNNYDSNDLANQVEVTEANFVVIYRITVIDSNQTTHPELTPVPNTILNNTNDNSGGGSSGGSVAWYLLAVLLSLALLKSSKRLAL